MHVVTATFKNLQSTTNNNINSICLKKYLDKKDFDFIGNSKMIKKLFLIYINLL